MMNRTAPRPDVASRAWATKTVISGWGLGRDPLPSSSLTPLGRRTRATAEEGGAGGLALKLRKMRAPRRVTHSDDRSTGRGFDDNLN